MNNHLINSIKNQLEKFNIPTYGLVFFRDWQVTSLDFREHKGKLCFHLTVKDLDLRYSRESFEVVSKVYNFNIYGSGIASFEVCKGIPCKLDYITVCWEL